MQVGQHRSKLLAPAQKVSCSQVLHLSPIEGGRQHLRRSVCDLWSIPTAECMPSKWVEDGDPALDSTHVPVQHVLNHDVLEAASTML